MCQPICEANCEAAELLRRRRQAKRLKKRSARAGAKLWCTATSAALRTATSDESRFWIWCARTIRASRTSALGRRLASEAADHGLAARNLVDACGRPVEPPPQAPGASPAAAAQSALRRADPGRRFETGSKDAARKAVCELRRRCNRCGAGPFLKRGNNLGGGRSAGSLGAPIPFPRRCNRLEERLQAPADSGEAIEGIEPETQFGRMCAKLGIRIIAAASPQAKGRVERHHGTHQDRMIKKMRLKGIADYEASEPLSRRALSGGTQCQICLRSGGGSGLSASTETSDLKWVFCLEAERVVSNDLVVRFENRFLQLKPKRNRLWAGPPESLCSKRARGSCKWSTKAER